MPEQLVSRRTLALIVALSFCFAGCDASRGTPPASDNQLRFVGRLMLEYYRAHQGSYPASKEDFIKYLEANRKRWESPDLPDAESLLVSPHDGKALVLVPASQVGPTGSSNLPIVAFEQEGVGGVRKAINARGSVLAIESRELELLFPNLK